jgi:hypothetical protein
MNVLNTQGIPYFSSNGFELRGSAIIHNNLADFDDSPIYYVEFFSGEDMHIFETVTPPHILDSIRKREVTLVINNSHEAFHHIVDPLYRILCVELNLPPEQIVLLSESAIINQEIATIAKKYNLPRMQSKWIRICEHNIRISNTTVIDTLELKEYPKKYLNFNRRWRPHRPVFVGLLKLNNLLDQGYVSLAPSDDNRNWENFIDILGTYDPQFIGREQEILNTEPLYLDTKDLHINQAILTDSTDFYYSNTYFSVVSETNFYKDFGEGVFLSEKVFKPIKKMHPFILLNRPFSLSALRSLGYKTFGNVIDERYDIQEDDQTRIRMILEETRRLCNLNINELEHFLNECKIICRYNYDLLHSKKTFYTMLI